jgi:hypothetical protein
MFLPETLVLTSFMTSHKPYFPWSVTPKIQDEFLIAYTWICFLNGIEISRSESL